MITIREINNFDDLKSFYNESSDSLHIVKIGAPWCGPCNVLSTTLKNLDETKINGSLIASVNVDEDGSEDIVSEYSIRNVPVILFIKNGELLNKVVGSVDSDTIYKKIDEYK
jgi:thioredoxin 1